MSKALFTVLAICLATTTFAQSKNLNGNVTFKDVKVENFEISVEVDSAEEIESSFKIEDLKEILNEANTNENIVFRIKCNDRVVNGTVKSHIEYEIKGNTNEKKKFLKGIKKIRNAAIKYYNSKK